MSSYWPWWAGAIALALVTINHTLTTDRSLGVSNAWDRVVHWRRERAVERVDAGLDQRALVEALAAGPAATGPAPTAATIPTPSSQVSEDEPALRRPMPLASQIALLVSVTLGGTLAAATSGRLQLHLDMGQVFSTVVTGNPWGMVAVLFVGGVLVGFGTRLAGGCSSGHGLSGCGRLYPTSILATAVFFGTAVGVSTLLAL
ncbi:YeeE/YedE family protein [Pseudonocardia endophytica]|uniref:Uncharacterized protein n=1 Tax=Pseudonocardia endophytica TaxID=401976 RepID=A0A4R1HJW3_PSEEN|nr:YeeE/YedE thiosulfate transporter family protein [Pseudonocardia endophytica]TCK20795.1 hypothetical protein EV378_4759 [Pseudonocardia endophytica]